MNTWTHRSGALFAVALGIGGIGSAAAGQEIETRTRTETRTETVEVRKFYLERPPGTVAIVGVEVNDMVQLFQDRSFTGQQVDLVNVASSQPAGQLHEMPGGMNDSLSSMRWNLPAGVLMIFYEDAGGKGEQLAIWGNGQIEALSEFDINDKISRWAWYYVGGAHEPTEVVVRGAVLPYGSVVWTVTPTATNSMQLFKSKNFEANTVAISPVTTQPANTLHRLPEDLPDSLTSMRWSLPPGVVVQFYQDADAGKQQVSMWGDGQVSDLDIWDFNDKASRWAWYYIGSPEPAPLAYVPPTKPDVIIVEVDKDAIGLVAREMKPTELGITENDLRAKKNPTGEGTFVYVPRTQFDGVERHVVWIVIDGKAYAITGPAKMITPDLLTPLTAVDTTWRKTGLSTLQAEEDAIKVVFTD